MRVLFLTNNKVSDPLIDWLERAGNGVIVHSDPLTIDVMRVMNPKMVVSYSYRHIIKPDVLAILPDGFVNLHIALLPFNKGADPNAWSFLDNTPKGVTIHFIDEGLDTGPIIAQKEVHFNEDTNTLGGTYATLQSEIQTLFREKWDAIRTGTTPSIPQRGIGTYHHSSEFAAIREELMGPEGWNVTIAKFRRRYVVMRDGRAYRSNRASS